ncbi:hypothetical protein BCD67_24820 [Oscillatoriales cyanobacterium USR001]|nr:hypothetical protein BCD67_24820 [Oscillatoriales cyanobacterium USR001]
MITNNEVKVNVYFRFDKVNNSLIASIDTDNGWSLFVEKEACEIYEFVSRFIDLPEPEDMGIEPPDETE